LTMTVTARSWGSRSCAAQIEELEVADSVRLMADPNYIFHSTDPFAADPDEFWRKLREKISQPDLTPEKPDVDPFNSRENTPCMIDAFFKNEAKKPIGQRSSACMISCPCPRCNPYCM